MTTMAGAFQASSSRLAATVSGPGLQNRLLVMLEGGLAALLAFQLVHIFWMLAVPAGPAISGQPASRQSLAIDRALMASFDPFFRQSTDTASTTVSSLALTLLGTRVDTVSGRGSAIVATPDGLQASYLVGETIAPGVRLKSVEFDGITLDRGGAVERLFLDQSAGGAPITPASPTQPPIPSDLKSRLVADIAFAPRLSGTNVTGLALTPKGDGTAFAAAGLRPGDVLVAIDGAQIATIGDPASIEQRFRSGVTSVVVERGGKPVTIQVQPAQ